MPQLIALPLLFLVVLQSLAGVSADPLLPHGLRGLQQSNVTTSNTTSNTNNNNNNNLNIGPRFDAIDATYQVETLGTGGFSIPPDPHGAAGKHSVIAVVNDHIEARNKNGGLLWRSTLRNFFSPQGDLGSLGTDPKIIYDSHEQRFVVVYLATDKDIDSAIFLAVSKNGNPKTWRTSDWYFHTINSRLPIDNQTTWADYPGFEVDEQAIYITANMYVIETAVTNPGAFVQSRLWIVDKGVNGGFYGGGAATVKPSLPIKTSDNLFLGTYQPAEIRASNPSGAGPGIGTYLVSYGFDGLSDPTSTSERLSIVRVDNPLGNPSLVQSYVSLTNIEATTVNLTDAPQRGITARIETNDRRVLDAVWHKNALWCVFTIMRDGKAKAFWVKLTTNVAQGQIAALVDKGPILGEDIAGNGTYTYFPSVAVNNRGIAVFGFSASAQSIYAGAYVTMRDDKNDPRGEVRASQVVRKGEAPYAVYDADGENRWGDYSGISVDPADENCFWIYNMYAAPLDCGLNPTGCWGTGWARLCYH